jgi:potassium/hydrogen antiporter
MMPEGTEIAEIIIEEGSRATGKSIKELKIPRDSILALLIREGEKPVIPSADTVLRKNDRLIVLTSLDTENLLENELIPEETNKKSK